VALNASSAPAVFGWQPHWPESQRLAESLRYCRLTLLCGAAGSGKSSLLNDGLMPLLQRRAVDAALRIPRASSPVIMPFPERRSTTRARLAELVVLFDAGGDAPLARLHERIDAALLAAGVMPEPHPESLAGRVQSLGERWGTKFLFVIDRFEALLRPTAGADERGALLDELVVLLNRRLSANVLVAMRSEDHALLESFENRLHAVDPEMMVLPGPHDADGAPAPRSRLAVAPPVPERSAAAHARWHQDSQLPVLGDAPLPEPQTPFAAWPSRAAAAAPGPGARAAWRWRWQVALVLAPLAMVAFALPLVWSESPPAAAVPERGPAPASADTAQVAPPGTLATGALTAASPVLALQVESEGPGAARLPAELARALAADGRLALDVKDSRGGLAALPASDEQPQLAIVRYDALQDAANDRPQRRLGVVAPLYTEEIHVVVRADSPLRFIHEIKGKRINIGAAESGRALTANNLYRRMFGVPIPKAADAALDARSALQRLVAGKTLDAVLLVAPQPAEALAALPTETRRAVRLLRLAPEHPASMKALQAYLPASVQGAGGGPTPTLAAMAFLVATGTQDAASSEAITRFTKALCDSLPGLQARGDAKWRELKPGLQLPTAWPVAPAAEAAWGDCAGPTTAADSSSPQTLATGHPPTPTKGARP
jgi:TRAP-type uncharacterized transport system substrate-binding protein